jgi:hypothetical protein
MEITESRRFRSGLYLQGLYAGKKAYTKHTGNKKTAHKTQTHFLQTVSQMDRSVSPPIDSLTEK